MHAILIDSMGDDLTVVNSARVSFAKYVEEFTERDTKLLKYLADHNHWTPFSHVTASFQVSAPIFVARQLMKSCVGFAVNEVSRRYIDDEAAFWSPADHEDTWRSRHTNKKQGSAGAHPRSREHQMAYMIAVAQAKQCYEDMIADGVAPEQARAVLPQGTYTTWIWTASLAAYARMCKLRLQSDAQTETRVIAEAISEQLRAVAPVSWEVLLGDY